MLPIDAIRPYHPQDLPTLTDLYAALLGAPQAPEQVEARLRRISLRPEENHVLALTGDRVVGISLRFPQSPLRAFVEASVHPAFRRQGIGRALIAAAVESARQAGAQQAAADVDAADQAGQQFTLACGFQQAGEARVFTAPADWSPPEAAFPAGWRLKSGAEFGDLQIYADASNRCYHDLWGHWENLQPLTVAQIEVFRARSPKNFLPERLFVLFSPDGAPSGLTRVSEQGDRGMPARVIDAPGIAPEYRDSDLYIAFVAAVARRLRDQAAGPYRIETWGDNAAAVAAYQQMGFSLEESTHSIQYVRPLTSQG